MTVVAEHPRLHCALGAGLRWLYETDQPESALVDRLGAHLTAGGRRLRFLPISASGTPAIMVDVDLVPCAAGCHTVALNALPLKELPGLAGQFAAFGIPVGCWHFHGVTGVISLDVPAHPSLRAAVARHARGCPRHHTVLCAAVRRDGEPRCPWRTAGHRAAIWPDAVVDEGDW